MEARVALRNCRVAFVAPEDLEEADVLAPLRLLEEAGYCVELIGARSPQLRLLRRGRDGVTEKVLIQATRRLDEIAPDAYQALALAGVRLQDRALEVDRNVVEFVRRMQAAGKPVMCFPRHAAERAVAAEAENHPVFPFRRILADSWRNWNAINAPRLGAALAYYSLLSLAPVLIVTVVIAGLLFHRAEVRANLIIEVRELLGSQVAETVRAVLNETSPKTGAIAGAISVLILLLSASSLFQELRDALNTVWGAVPNYGTGLISLIRARAFAFLMVLGAGGFVILFLALTAILSSPVRFILRFLPEQVYTVQLLTIAGSFGGMTLIFALIYKVVPDMYVRWSDVWTGALVTSALFSAGKELIGIYLQRASVGSAYAAAGSLAVFLTWVYYSAQIFLFGAEFTHLYAFQRGSYSWQKNAN